MNVLHVIGSMDPKSGGVCQVIRNSSETLKRMSVHIEVACTDDPASKFLGKDLFKIHALGPGKGPWSYSVKLLYWLEENLGRFDVVVINGLWLFHDYAVRKALIRFQKDIYNKRLKNKAPRLFIMPHGMLDPYFQHAPGRKLKALRNWLYWKLIEAKIIKYADGLLFTCETELQLAKRPFSPYKPKKEINVGLGIEAPPVFTNEMCQAFSSKCPGVKDRPFLLFISRIHPKKGVDLLLKAYALVLKGIVDKNMPQLVIAGPGLETDYGQMLQTLVAENPNLQSMVFFPGMLSGDAKWGAFYNCEAFVLPSHQENFGIAVVEALACKKPVLISNQVNIWKEIETEGGGIIANDTLQGTKKLIENWLELNSTQRQTMQQRAYATYEKYFEMKLAANKFLQAISS